MLTSAFEAAIERWPHGALITQVETPESVTYGG